MAQENIQISVPIIGTTANPVAYANQIKDGEVMQSEINTALLKDVADLKQDVGDITSNIATIEEEIDSKIDGVTFTTTKDQQPVTLGQGDTFRIEQGTGIKVDRATVEGEPVSGTVLSVDTDVMATKEEVETQLEAKANITEVNTALNQKANKATTLAGYGITDAYTKNQVDAAIDNIDVTGQLADYAKKTEVSTAVAAETARAQGVEATKANAADVTTSLASKADKSEVTTGLAAKQDTISDLATIRSGAALGATAKQPATTIAGYGITDAYTKQEVNNLVSTPHQNYVTVATKADLDAITTGSADTIYRVSNYDGTQVDTTKYAEYTWDGTGYILLSVKSAVGEVFDVSEYNSGATYETLATALAAVPAAAQRGGMSIKFIQSSDNKYVRYRCIANAWSTNTGDWSLSNNVLLLESQEYIYVLTDEQSKLLVALKQDGNVFFGAGCPPQIIDYVTEQINIIKNGTTSTDIDGLDKIKAFLADFSTRDVLKDIISNIEERIPEYSSSENIIKAVVDNNYKILEMYDQYGNKVLTGDVEFASFQIKNQNHPDWIKVEVDKDGKILSGTKSDGSHYSYQLQSETIENINNACNELQAKCENILFRKKWAVVGDSFTYNGYQSSQLTEDCYIQDGKYKGQYRTYKYIIGNRNDMTIVDESLGGRTMAYPSDHSFSNAFANPSIYQSLPLDADYITIMLGINDQNHMTGSSGDGEDTTGEITIGTIDDTDTSTFYGAWNTVLEYIISNYPFAHLGIIITNGLGSPATTGDATISELAKQLYNAELEIAEKWGIPYLDLNGGNGAPLMNRSANENVCAEARKLRNSAYNINSSNTHPNWMAHEYESIFIENFLKKL